MEVMIAVAVLSLTAAAALKLVVLSQNSLREVKDREEMQMAAMKIRTGILAGELKEDGTDGNIRWKTEVCEKEFFNKDFGKLNFDKKESNAITADSNFKWRELEIENTATHRKMKIVLPLNDR